MDIALYLSLYQNTSLNLTDPLWCKETENEYHKWTSITPLYDLRTVFEQSNFDNMFVEISKRRKLFGRGLALCAALSTSLSDIVGKTLKGAPSIWYKGVMSLDRLSIWCNLWCIQRIRIGLRECCS
jgi:hypothetical protein